MKIATFSERLAQALEQNGMKAAELCRICGISKSTMSQYLSGKYFAKHDRVVMFAEALGCNPYWLEGHDAPMRLCSPDFTDGDPAELGNALPVLGYVAAGSGMFADDSIRGYEYADRRFCDGEHFYLIVEGDSMAPGLAEGDRVLCRRQDTLENGQTGVFIIDGDRGLVKNFEFNDGRIRLISINPNYPPIVFNEDDTDRVRIVGRVVQSVRNW